MKNVIIPALIAAVSMSSTAFAHGPNTEVNFAFGGARTDALNATAIFDPATAAQVNAAGLQLLGLTQQLAFAEETLGKVEKKDVFYLSVGTNDFLSSLVLQDLDLQVSVNRVVAALEDLYTEKKARYIVVPNLAPVGLLPLLALPGGPVGLPPEALAGLSAQSSGFNQLLAAAAADFEADHRDAQIVIVDVESIVKGIVADPLVNSVVPCNLTGAPSCEGFLFLDWVHPTTTVYARYAEAARAGLRAAGFRAPAEGQSCRAAGGSKSANRVITFGDSLADTGSYNDVVLRATGTPGLPEEQGFFAGRFSDGPTSIDHLEELLCVKHPSEFFQQPASN